MTTLDRGALLKLAVERALAAIRRRRLERWLTEPDERPAALQETKR